MDFINLFSLFLYVGTFLAGLYLDSDSRRFTNPRIRKYFIIWLYVFLCFGYMVGSDWRGYELEYISGTNRYITEPISNFFIKNFHKIIPDFWLFLGLIKCVYLWTVFCVLKKLTNYTLVSISLLLNLMLVYMLISNPLRYMIAMVFINIALCYFIEGYKTRFDKKKILYIVGLIILATLSHNTCFIFFVVFPSIYLFRDCTRINKYVLLVGYIFAIVITSEISIINEIKDYLNSYLMMQGDFQDYSLYEAKDNSSIFLVGNILKVFFFCIVLFTKDKVLGTFKYDRLCYSLTIFYFFMDRALMIIPSGFRIAIPFLCFYVVYVVYLLKNYYRMGIIFVLYLLLTFTRELWSSHVYIPYSNSIYYILTEHKSYAERTMYNYDAYKVRIGHSVVNDGDRD